MTITTKPDSVTLLSIINDFTVNVGTVVDGQVCRMVISASVSGQMYCENLTPSAAGVVTVSDLYNLMEVYLRDTVCETVTFTVTYGSDVLTYSCDVLYSRLDVKDVTSDFISNNYLTVAEQKRTVVGRTEELAWWNDDTTPEVTAYYADTNVEGKFNPTPVKKVYSDNVTYYALDVSPENFTMYGDKLYRYVVTVGDRRMEYEVQPDEKEPDPVILFKNDFGASEWFYLKGVKTNCPEYEFEATTINHRYVNYKVRETRYYNADTGVLNDEEIDVFLSMMRSHDIYLCEGTNGSYAKGREIAVTESDIEASNEDDALNRCTFKYRISRGEKAYYDVTKHPSIFSEHFTSVFY